MLIKFFYHFYHILKYIFVREEKKIYLEEKKRRVRRYIHMILSEIRFVILSQKYATPGTLEIQFTYYSTGRDNFADSDRYRESKPETRSFLRQSPLIRARSAKLAFLVENVT